MTNWYIIYLSWWDINIWININLIMWWLQVINENIYQVSTKWAYKCFKNSKCMRD